MIRLQGVTHTFARRPVLRDVDLGVDEASLCALLGPNGAGKSTLLQIATGLLRPSAGAATILGHPACDLTPEVRAQVVYVAEARTLPGWMRLRDAEAFHAPLYPSWDPELAAALRDRFGLRPERRIRTLSRGEGMKAALLCALAPRPRVLLLDEPFAGLDLLVRDQVSQTLREAVEGRQATILVASHEVGELEFLADQVAVLHRGHLLRCETARAARRSVPARARTASPPSPRGGSGDATLRDVFLHTVREAGHSDGEA